MPILPQRIPTSAKVSEIRAYPDPGVTMQQLVARLQELGNEIVEVNEQEGYVVLHKAGGK